MDGQSAGHTPAEVQAGLSFFVAEEDIMIHKSALPHTDHVRVTFELPSCLWAARVAVTGDFNSWNERATPMRQERDGVWRATVELPTGRRFEFRYVIDGQWQTDYHADGYIVSDYGSENSVIDTGEPAAEPLRLPDVGALLREAGPPSGAHRRPTESRFIAKKHTDQKPEKKAA